MASLTHVPDERQRTAASDTQTAMSAFSALWAMATLLHLLANIGGLTTLTDGSLVGVVKVLSAACAIGVLARPSCLRRLAALAALQILELWVTAPFVGNHWLLACLVSLALLGAMAIVRVRGRLDGPTVFTLFAPAARATLLIAYSFVVFGKMNVDFLRPVTSCAVLFTGDVTNWFGVSATELAGHGTVSRLLAVGILAIEASIPVMLVFRRTRNVGVAVALVFHFLVGLHPTRHFWDFTAVLIPLYLLFLPVEFFTDVKRAWTDHLERRATVANSSVADARRSLLVTLAAPAAILLVLLVFAAPRSAVFAKVVLYGRHAYWLAFGYVVIRFAVVWVWEHRSTTERAILRPASLLLCLVPALAFLNGLTPYTEVKTAFGWNMYANLTATGGETNHLLVPRTFPIDGRGGDLVTIVDSSDDVLLQYRDEGYALTFPQFQDYAALHPDIAVTYERDGEQVRVDRVGDVAELTEPLSVVDRKFRLLRAVDLEEHARCQPVWLPAH